MFSLIETLLKGRYPFIYNDNANVAKLGKEYPPEKALHSSVGVEQQFENDMSIKMEGFYNYFYDKPVGYLHYEEIGGPEKLGLTTRKLKTYGFEILLKKDIKLGQDGLFGWLSYTYTRSIEKSGLPTEDGYLGLYEPLTYPDGSPVLDGDGNPIMVPVNWTGDPYGDKWVNSNFELMHSLKLTTGYTFGRHTVSGKLQVYAWGYYTPITGHKQPYDFDPENPRYLPEYGKWNSKRNPPDYQLDLRYSYKITYSWGYVSWYVEALYFQWFDRFIDTKQTYEEWDFEKPYEEGVNPAIIEEEESPLLFLPNFGVEIKF